ncbi:hypothetical protein FJV41_17340 [Myxococcus llanfairpwllgwyngyllgogerychwyrndrobwllllantysiliogogogochensis]|uniref:Uncharacterized protein n=1 Tax=Myxococcus llanfairpwllgwyngyllgogerychwyrndrobwllllantysiliogogogochensis TaxID=2590453 RepID=A0A540X0D5_9BACT|nr:hypothetical protein FJV41_17340 [Myxococcus llanfairpwllgwyngyllgogerychwyrndrobwllllantysiliogogogochensis]
MIALKQASIDKLTAALDLPANGQEQDWEIELADPSRVDEFLTAYRSLPLSPDDKVALMALILASVDRRLDSGIGVPTEWTQIVELLRADRDLHRASLEYWTCEGDDDPDSWFQLTPLVRSVSTG